jgi:hypothetical protein
MSSKKQKILMIDEDPVPISRFPQDGTGRE